MYQLTSSEVIGQDVRPRCFVGPRWVSRRTSTAELAYGVDGATDDGLIPDHTVDLHRRESI